MLKNEEVSDVDSEFPLGNVHISIVYFSLFCFLNLSLNYVTVHFELHGKTEQIFISKVITK